jgi:O-antigen/teichoic acid export membrane protein
MLGACARAVFWLLGSVVAARRGTLVLGIIAGRLFAPREFGAVAAALVVVLAFRSVGEFGTTRALERYAGDPREVAPAVMAWFWPLPASPRPRSWPRRQAHRPPRR